MAIGPQQDISLHSGDSRILRVTVNDDAGTPLALTDATFIWQLSKKASDSVAPKGTSILSKDTGVPGLPAVDTWVAETLYNEDDEVVSDGYLWIMGVLGTATSGLIAPNGTDSPFFDGDCIWNNLGTAPSQPAVPGDIVITDTPNGIIEITVAPADTDALAGEYYHELQMAQGGNISTVLYGQATIVKDLI
jgi:hypothetical protein